MRWLVALPLLLSPLAAAAQQAFQMPSGNVFCDVAENALRCDIVAFSFPRPPSPPDCDSDWGHAYAVGAKGPARTLCAGDTLVNRGACVLPYGARWEGVGVTCRAERSGLTCMNAEGRGFAIARRRLTFF